MTSESARRDGPGRPRDPAADAAILRAAVDVLVEHGVEHASMERIARHAGVAKMTVYRRWRSKEDLLAQAIEHVRDDLPDASTAPDDLPATIEEYLPLWGVTLADPRFRALSARLLGAVPSHPKLLDAYWHHHVVPRRERARTALRRAQADGVLPADTDLEIVMDMMTGAVIHHLLLQPEPLDATAVTSYLRRLLGQVGFPVRTQGTR